MRLKRILLSIILPVTLGAGAGFAYYYFIGCASGSCPITSNPYISTGYGAGMGMIFMLGNLRSRKNNHHS